MNIVNITNRAAGGEVLSRGELVTIRLYESDRQKWYSRAAYEEMVQHLWSRGAPGVTVFRAEEGLDAKGHLQNIYSDYASNLPMTMEVYGTHEEIQQVSEELSDVLPKSSRIISIQNVLDLKRGEAKGEDDMGSASILRVYMKEGDRYHHIPLYDALLVELHKQNVLWVDVQRALEGFGQDHVIRKNRAFAFSEHSPIILEAVLDGDSEASVLESIRPMLIEASGPAILLPGRFVQVAR